MINSETQQQIANMLSESIGQYAHLQEGLVEQIQKLNNVHSVQLLQWMQEINKATIEGDKEKIIEVMGKLSQLKENSNDN